MRRKIEIKSQLLRSNDHGLNRAVRGFSARVQKISPVGRRRRYDQCCVAVAKGAGIGPNLVLSFRDVEADHFHWGSAATYSHKSGAFGTKGFPF